MIKLICYGVCFSVLFGFIPSRLVRYRKRRTRILLRHKRLWAEWNVVPFRINEDWTVLTRTIFRFVSLPLADPVLGVSPSGLPAVLGFDQKNSVWPLRCQPYGLSCPQSWF